MNPETPWQQTWRSLLALGIAVCGVIALYVWAIISGLASWLSAPLRWLRLAVGDLRRDGG